MGQAEIIKILEKENDWLTAKQICDILKTTEQCSVKHSLFKLRKWKEVEFKYVHNKKYEYVYHKKWVKQK